MHPSQPIMDPHQRSNDQDKLNQHQHHQPLRLKPPEMQPSQNQNQNHHYHQPPPPQKCPRCESSNTKFCYYNNYSLSQPRYFCKACRRYWTHGGTLRNVPVGGGCRKSKRPKPSAPSAANLARTQPLSPTFLPQTLIPPLNSAQPPMANASFYSGGSFLSSLAAMQSLSAGITQGAALNLGGCHYETNMALPPPPPPQQQFQYFPSQSIPPPRPSLTSWTQNFINRGPSAAATSTSAAGSSFWSGADHDQAGSSFNPNQWQDSSSQGFDPSSPS